jgi:hypothetical protein
MMSVGTKMPTGPLYKIRKCFSCDSEFEGSRFSARKKYCLFCIKAAEKSWGSEGKTRPPACFRKLKDTASRRGIEVTLSYDEYLILVSGRKCFYCSGSLPKYGGGIDRKYFKIGYVSGNCVPCCTRCNDRKGKLETCGFSYERVLQLLAELLA